MRYLLFAFVPLYLFWFAALAAPVHAQEAAPPPLDVEVAGSLQASLPVEQVRIFDAQTDPNRLLGRPGQYVGKVSWRDTRAPDSDATIELFADEPSLLARQRYVEAIVSSGGIFGQYVYANGPRLALLRLPFALTPDQAAEYAAWLATI